MPKLTFMPMNVTVEVEPGTTVLEAAHEHDLPLEGACEGSMACSTCHVVLPREWYDRLEGPSEEEEDTLDEAFGLTPTSRLGCQIVMGPKLDGLVVTIPDYNVNIGLGRKK
ncbi:MAG: 2Fe-2S iron-sulfur cluster binding domain-containing protein [Magnetococcales bacterium]|nr:2Fe-2S iron-sulfur cluster binding domain-containing protein [Magnetococcales bacterium]